MADEPGFIGAILVSLDLPPELLGDYHLQPGSIAINKGALNKNGVNAPAVDIDGDTRPAGGGFDAGSDELPATVPTPPPAPFPATSVLDNFNRANSTNLGRQLVRFEHRLPDRHEHARDPRRCRSTETVVGAVRGEPGGVLHLQRRQPRSATCNRVGAEVVAPAVTR